MKSAATCIVWFLSLLALASSQSATTGEGFGNDPGGCNADGEFFTCRSPSSFMSGENQTFVMNNIRCPLASTTGFDFQANPTACQCSADLEEGDRRRTCACGVCPKGRATAIALDCDVAGNEGDIFIVGQCSSLDCDGRCNGTGVAVVNQPTPAPAGGEGDLDEDGASSMNMLAGLLIGTMLSLVSVYW